MQKLELYAVHTDGRKLYYPVWDRDGEIVNTRKPTAAVTIDQDGVTFPPGSVWIRKPRSSGLQAGWHFADTIKGKKTTNRPIENTGLVRRTMTQDQILQR